MGAGNSHHLRDEYTARVNRVIDHIQTHLVDDLTLDMLADIAGFSRFHFHRIFRALTGETVKRFTQRLRVEKAANLLVHNPKLSITEVAFSCGFSGSASFARSFKEFFGMSASEWRDGGHENHGSACETNSKERKAFSKPRKDPLEFSMYIDGETNNPSWSCEVNDMKVEIKDMPAMPVVYLRHIGPYQKNVGLFERLVMQLLGWAGPRGLLKFPETQLMAVYYDDPAVTDDDKLRLDICITVDEGTKVDGEYGVATLPAGKCAIARFEIEPNGYEEAWNKVYKDWLPQSGFQPDDRPCIEFYINDPKEHPEGKHIVDICVPVKPM